MFRRVLIANRGEIALRILRTLKEMGILAVCVYSEADKNAKYLRLADAAICIGPGPAKDSYLDILRIISAAEIADSDAIHPGYGFLSENPDFVKACEEYNVTFIGPSSETMKLCGDKLSAKQICKKLKIPTVPGSDGEVKDENTGVDLCRKIGYPVILKASGGGGGRGMRVIHNELTLKSSFKQAQSEAAAAFKNPTIFIEKLIQNARHIEIQILADKFGNVIYLGERDCTIQRRFQKLIEESPSPVVNAKLRNQMGESAVEFAKAVRYTGAGTVEFLVDGKGNFYLIEMNARLQVEHPVTEMVTGIDIVREQIKIAAGEKLSYSQKDIVLRGHAIEFRINAENPRDGFKPCPGTVTQYGPPGGPGIRLDTQLYSGYEIPPFYDSMIAKLIVCRRTREDAINIAKVALQEFIIDGVHTTIPLHIAILNHPQFVRSDYSTMFLETVLNRLLS